IGRHVAVGDFCVQIRVRRCQSQTTQWSCLKNQLSPLRFGAVQIEECSRKCLEIGDLKLDQVAKTVVEPVDFYFHPVIQQALFHSEIEAARPLRPKIGVPQKVWIRTEGFGEIWLFDSQPKIKFQLACAKAAWASSKQISGRAPGNHGTPETAVLFNTHTVRQKEPANSHLILKGAAKIITLRTSRSLRKREIVEKPVFAIPLECERENVLSPTLAGGSQSQIALVIEMVAPGIIHKIRKEIEDLEGCLARAEKGRERRIEPELRRSLARAGETVNQSLVPSAGSLVGYAEARVSVSLPEIRIENGGDVGLSKRNLSRRSRKSRVATRNPAELRVLPQAQAEVSGASRVVEIVVRYLVVGVQAVIAEIVIETADRSIQICPAG